MPLRLTQHFSIGNCSVTRYHWPDSEADALCMLLDLKGDCFLDEAEREWTKIVVPKKPLRPVATISREASLRGGMKAKGVGGRAKVSFKEKLRARLRVQERIVMSLEEFAEGL